jgi:allophanate hydrolase
LLALGARLHRASVATLGALGAALPPLPAAAPTAPAAPAAPAPPAPPAAPAGFISLAVCGAHMEGLALNHQLRERGACLLQRTQTAPRYRLFVLPGGPPQRPGLVRVTSGGERIDLEVWAMPAEQVGAFVAAIPAPLGIGTIELASGAQVSGFICEAYAAQGAPDITALGGWRRFMTAGAEH